jgi:hypothetical protein
VNSKSVILWGTCGNGLEAVSDPSLVRRIADAGCRAVVKPMLLARRSGRGQPGAARRPPPAAGGAEKASEAHRRGCGRANRRRERAESGLSKEGSEDGGFE